MTPDDYPNTSSSKATIPKCPRLVQTPAPVPAQGSCSHAREWGFLQAHNRQDSTGSPREEREEGLGAVNPDNHGPHD